MFARAAGVRPSFVTQLVKDRRVPEAVRDEEDGRYRLPNRRCVIPSRRGTKGGKIRRYYFRRDKIPREWVDDHATRPGSVDEDGHFVGKRLEGGEDETLASRIERTFGVKVGKAQPPEDILKGKGLFPSLFMRCPVRVEVSGRGPMEGTLVDVDERGIVLNQEAGVRNPHEQEREQDGGGLILRFAPWASVLLIEARVV